MKKPKETDTEPNLKWICAQSRSVWFGLSLLAAVGVATACINMCMTRVMQQFVDIAAGDSNMPLLNNAVMSVLILAAEGILALCLSVSYRRSVNITSKKLRMDMVQKVYRSSLLEVQRHTSAEYMTNLTADVEKVSACLPDLIRDTVGNALSALLGVAYLFWINWKLALVLLVSIPLLILCVMVFSPIVQKASQADTENEERIRVYLQDVVEKLAIFKTYAMGGKIDEKLAGLLNRKVKSSQKLGAAEGGSAFLNTVMGSVMFLIALGGGALLVSRGEMKVGGMIAVVQLTNYIVWPFTAVGDIISEANQAIVAARRLGRVYGLGQEERFLPARHAEAAVDEVRMEGLSFGYSDDPVIRDVTQSIGKGMTAVIGESGCGKSTLLKVLAGLYPPEGGRLELHTREDGTLTDVRAHIGFVPADNLVFSDTIQANICMAAEVDSEKLERCASQANIGGYISTLPERYGTVVNDGRLSLSSGQAQRIAIARALYQGADVLLFDEPTANLDAESIEIFLKTLRQLADDHICIVVTHDPRVTGCCQRVMELKGGRLSCAADGMA